MPRRRTEGITKARKARQEKQAAQRCATCVFWTVDPLAGLKKGHGQCENKDCKRKVCCSEEDGDLVRETHVDRVGPITHKDHTCEHWHSKTHSCQVYEIKVAHGVVLSKVKCSVCKDFCWRQIDEAQALAADREGLKLHFFCSQCDPYTATSETTPAHHAHIEIGGDE